MRIKAVVSYDGTGYSGFQRQKNAIGIQQELEQVLEKLLRRPTRIIAAGRTDAGVHAVGQVVAFDTTWSHPLNELHRGLNALLPEQIGVTLLQEVGPLFHPRYDAVWRSYQYTCYLAPIRNPLLTRYSLHVSRSLCVPMMQQAARKLIGRHNFAAFGSPPKGNNTVRDVYKAEWYQRGSWLYFDVVANAFLYRMVRILVGTLLKVGFGTLTLDVFDEILRSQERCKVGPAVAAKGLCLTEVRY